MATKSAKTCPHCNAPLIRYSPSNSILAYTYCMDHCEGSQLDSDAQIDYQVNNDDFTAAFSQDIHDIEREISLHNRREQ